ncbi:MAG TPA: NADP-dependent isocitrate dehydrogenase [Balneolaceae bacterium]|nr:NADP-dependent isocitrate dehydrogenase [Balneolaceae bacterium]
MKTISVAYGDGIGPEIMQSAISVLKAAGASLEFEKVEIGEKAYLAGNSAGITDAAWQSIRSNKVFLKAPIMTPQGGGFKSLNVTLRKTLGLYANVRPCKSLHPFVKTKHPDMDVVIIRENEEDLYAGIEHQQTREVVQCLKLITRPGCERIIRYAFEYAKVYNRQKVSCFVKDNIMKHTDGLFNRVFKEIAAEYPEIESESWIVDIGAARVSDTPEIFDVIVMPNLYGDIISDITAQISSSIGTAGTANIGDKVAMFEAIHGSAPDIAGKDVANPSGLIRASVMMLNQLGMQDTATKIMNAWFRTIEDGIHTPDMYNAELSTAKVGTKEFTRAIIDRLGLKPEVLSVADYVEGHMMNLPAYKRKESIKTLKGVDIFVDWGGSDPDELGSILQKLNNEAKLSMITNRGVKVWPNGFDETFCTDHWRCRYEVENGHPLDSNEIPKLLAKAIEHNVDVIKTENLYEFDGERAYSLGQGQ